MNQLINDEAVYRTASATPGLLIIPSVVQYSDYQDHVQNHTVANSLRYPWIIIIFSNLARSVVFRLSVTRVENFKMAFKCFLVIGQEKYKKYTLTFCFWWDCQIGGGAGPNSSQLSSHRGFFAEESWNNHQGNICLGIWSWQHRKKTEKASYEENLQLLQRPF